MRLKRHSKKVMMFNFPQINPIAFSLGPIDVRWYALAYMAGFIIGWYILRLSIKKYQQPLSLAQLDTLLNASLLGVILGGRLGYVLFYHPEFYLANPVQIIAIWQGGMSFHGGFLGVLCAVIAVARYYRLSILAVSDAVCMVAPIGLFFGRIANFINAELYGRVTSSVFGVVFPNAGPLPRHPSQLYEAGLEGMLLFIFLFWQYQKKFSPHAPAPAPHGYILAYFLIGYGLSRYVVEFAREPDAHIGYLVSLPYFTLSMGQLLSLPMILAGLSLIIFMRRITPHG